MYKFFLNSNCQSNSKINAISYNSQSLEFDRMSSSVSFIVTELSGMQQATDTSLYTSGHSECQPTVIQPSSPGNTALISSDGNCPLLKNKLSVTRPLFSVIW